MREFLKKNWLGVIGLVVGLMGMVLSLIFYTRTLASREPTFVVAPTRTEIIRAERLSDAPLKIVRAKGGEISGDVTSVRVYLWNRGSLAIKRENVLKPLTLTLGDPEGDILDFSILKVSREVVKPQVSREPEAPDRSLSFDFEILERDDGFCLQIIYVGSPSADFRIDGRIEGVRHDIGSSQVEKSRFWPVYLNKAKTFLFVLILAVAFMGGMGIVFSLPEWLQKKTGKSFRFLDACIKWSVIVCLASSALGLVWALVPFPLTELRIDRYFCN